MQRRHRKELVKLARKTSEWDWCFLHEYVITVIRHMYEYYDADINVWQTDETRLPILSELKQILDWQAELDSDDPDVLSLKNWWKYTLEREQETYERIYTFIGKNITGWWD